MNLIRKFLVIACFAVLVCSAPAALAGGDHDHGAGPSAAGPAAPRFYAVSEIYELVDVINDRQLTVYLDRFSDGSPVKDAKIDLELGGVKVPLESRDGVYVALLERAPAPGATAVMAMVVAGNESDLLAGELDIQADEHGDSGYAFDWSKYGIWGGAAMVAFVLMIGVFRRSRASRLGGAA